MAEFTAVVQQSLLGAIAATAGVQVSSVRIVSVVQGAGRRRRLLAQGPGIAIEIAIEVPSSDGNHNTPPLAARITTDKLNQELRDRNLPQATMLKPPVMVYLPDQCGDGMRSLSEDCDDDNIFSGDGCSTNCTVECGFICSNAEPSLCSSTCGDSVVASDELCDDGGASGGCKSCIDIEPGWECVHSVCGVSDCSEVCGDGIATSGEECDDGNTMAGDGCSLLCQIEVPLSILSVLLDGDDTFVLNERSLEDEMPNPQFEVRILTPPRAVMFDRILIWFDRSRNRIISDTETVIYMGLYTTFRFELDIKGLPPYTGYNMSLHMMLQDNLVDVLLLPSNLEIRAADTPFICSMSPQEGPDFGGNFLLLGVLNAGVFLGERFGFKMQDGRGIESTGESLPAIAMSEWGGTSQTYLEVMKRTSNLRIASKALIMSYDNVISTCHAALEDNMVGAFLIVVVPRAQKFANSTAFGIMTAGKRSQAELQFLYEYVRTPRHAATVISATTAQGTASGGMSGGDEITVILTNFVITYQLSDLAIVFGDQHGTIIGLEQSNRVMTKIKALVPPGAPGTVNVSLANQNHPQNYAIFGFEYIDDRIPEVQDVVPFTVYADGGYQIMVTIENFPHDLGLEEISIHMRVAATGLQLGPSFQPQTLDVHDLRDDRVVTRIAFLTKNLVNATGSTSVRARIAAREKAVDFSLQYMAVPAGPPAILWMQPMEGMCNDGRQSVSVMLNNLRTVTDESALTIRFHDRTLSGDDEGVSIFSTMSETLISFVLPALDVAIVGRQELSFHTSQGRMTSVHSNFTCKDPRKAMLLYTIPSSGDAGGAGISVTLGIQKAISWSLSNIHLIEQRCAHTKVVRALISCSSLCSCINFLLKFLPDEVCFNLLFCV